jgi:N-acetylmuramoyl-L-alanine amidase
VALLALLCGLAGQGWASGAQSRKQEARLQFEKAEQMREALNGRPEAERTRREYQRVADAYRKVYYVAPASSKADASVMAVAELLVAMGRQFPPGEKDLHSAIAQYQFLRKEYPGSKYRVEALFTIGQIYKEDLDDVDEARSIFEEFLRRYPHDQRAPQAREALAELKEPTPKKEKLPEAHIEKPPRSTPVPTTTSEVTPPIAIRKSGLQLVTGIRHWSAPDSTRVAIDVDGPVEYQAGRVPHPDRIFFDLPNTKLVSTLVGKSFDVQDGFLKKIRVAQYQRDSIRVVLEVHDVSEYSAFLLPNPYRLIIDVHGRQTGAPAEVAGNALPENSDKKADESKTVGPSLRSILSGNVNPGRGTTQDSSNPNPSKEREQARAGSAQIPMAKPSKPSDKKNLPTKIVADADDTGTSPPKARPEQSSKNEQLSSAKRSSDAGLAASAARANKGEQDVLLTGLDETKNGGIKATQQPTSAPTAVAVAPREKGKKNSRAASDHNAAAREAVPTSAGDRSLTRALGLKIGRIVIDAGHGGHDTGTVGPNGLMEKDLVLDVSLRLGRLLETRLGADVIYTRDDDTFIPLETRTAIANEKQADLFISIHANSSPDASARGVETYYLNFTSNADALEVAARENAVSEKSIHELQDLVKKITLKEKIEESRELASDVQQSLYSGLATKNSTLRNRGVKKAPFVVLIGANMPSILAEISFVSNPGDERKLDTPEYRQKIADSLYKGIAKYAGGLSGVKVASKIDKESEQ